MDKSAIDSWAERSRAIDLDGIPWEDVRRIPLGADAVRTLRYMQDIEHTVIYVRQLLATRAIDDPTSQFRPPVLRGDVPTAARARCPRRESHPSSESAAPDAHGWIEERAMGAVVGVATVAVHWSGVRSTSSPPSPVTSVWRSSSRIPSWWTSPDASSATSRGTSLYYHQAERRLRSYRATRGSSSTLLGTGGERAADPEVRFLAGFRGAAGCRRAQDRRDHPAAARLRGRRARRIVARTGDPRADDGRGPHGTGREDGASVARSVTSCEAQPIPNAPSSTNRRRAQGCTQASRATAPTARAGSNPRSAPRTLDGRPKVSATRSA